jgi:FlgD Ig-like domain
MSRSRPCRVPQVVILLLALAFASTSAHSPVAAAPLYTVGFTNGGVENYVSSATPFGRDSSYAMAQSAGDGIATGNGRAMEGRVGTDHRLDITWQDVGAGTFGSTTYAITTTDDFLITGPAGPSTVPGVLNLRMQESFELQGGFPGDWSHLGNVNVVAEARASFWPFGGIAFLTGDYRYTNAGALGTGALEGQSGAALDAPLSLAANFPVNVPFTVRLRLESTGSAYGNGSCNPGLVACHGGGISTAPFGAGLRLTLVDGRFMTLPAGYTLNVPSWGIVDNTSTVTGVNAIAPGRMRLEAVGSNPFRSQARLALYLPKAESARVVVVDVAGRAIHTLTDGWQAAGRLDLVWDGTAAGISAPAGLYFVRAECAGERATLRLALVR